MTAEEFLGKTDAQILDMYAENKQDFGNLLREIATKGANDTLRDRLIILKGLRLALWEEIKHRYLIERV